MNKRNKGKRKRGKMLKKGSRMNDTGNEVLYLTEDEEAKIVLYHLTAYKTQEEEHDMLSS
jgi:hypothetical protein